MWPKLLTLVGTIVLDWVYKKAAQFLVAYLKREHAKEEILRKAKETREKTEKSETPKEREDAARDVINNF